MNDNYNWVTDAKTIFPSFQDERQDKIHHFSQPQPLVYSYTGPIPYPILTQNILPLAQPPVVVPFPQPEIMEVPKAKETILPKHKEMRFPKSPVEPFIESQSLTLTDLENLHLPLPLLKSLMHQPPHRLPPTPMFPPQPLQSLSQPKVLPIPQQVVPYLQRDMPIQALLLYQEPVLGPIRGLYPVIVSPNLLIVLFHLWCFYDVRVIESSRIKEKMNNEWFQNAYSLDQWFSTLATNRITWRTSHTHTPKSQCLGLPMEILI